MMNDLLNKKIVSLHAPVLTESGYGVHSRQVVKNLISKNNIELFVDALRWGNCPWSLNKNSHNGLIGEIFKYCSQPPKDKQVDVNIDLRLPNEITKSQGMFNILISAFCETDIFNPSWINSINQTQLTIVPSTFTKKGIEETAKRFNKFVVPPIEVIPESFNNEILNPDLKPLDLNLETDFNFLIFGQITGTNPHNDRKNLFNTIKLLCETFKSDKKVGIILKTNAGRNTTKDKFNCENILRRVLKECRKGKYPKVYLLHGNMDHKEVASLYKHPKIKALVSLTKGEGWCLPMIDAVASDLPVLATNWSGHLDYLNEGKWIKINYELKPIHQSLLSNKNIFIEGAKWAEVIEDDAKRKIAKFRECPDLPQEWAKQLGEIIRKKYNFKEISKKYDEVFNKHNIF